jgi:ATP adenylyltransferase
MADTPEFGADMDRMWSPWRSAYLDTFKKPKKDRTDGKSIFAIAFESHRDNEHLIVHRSTHCFVIMNRYPYNSGHVMIVPNRQESDFTRLSTEEVGDMMALVQLSIRAIGLVMKPQGFNVGANLGRVSGAGVDTHVHMHVVPRWNGDTNFMPVVATTKVISEDMRRTHKNLREAFSQILSEKSEARRDSRIQEKPGKSARKR